MTPLTVICVERTEVLRTGERNGRPWTLYSVTCKRNGQPISAPCKTFDSLPVGLVKVTLEADRDGVSTLIKLPKRAAPGRTPPTDDIMAARVEKLERTCARLERRLNALVELESHQPRTGVTT